MSDWNRPNSTISDVRSAVRGRYKLRIQVVDPESTKTRPTFLSGKRKLQGIKELASRLAQGLTMPSLEEAMTVAEAEARFLDSWGVKVEILEFRGKHRAKDTARLSSVGFTDRKIVRAEPEPPAVFISYRRGVAGCAYAQLVNEFLQSRKIPTTLDVSTLRAGEFEPQLESKIRNSSRFLLVCTPTTFQGIRNADDWIRKEIEISLRHGRTVIPFATPGFAWPTDSEDPELIRRLKVYQVFSYRHETWATDKEGFIKRFIDS